MCTAEEHAKDDSCIVPNTHEAAVPRRHACTDAHASHREIGCRGSCVYSCAPWRLRAVPDAPTYLMTLLVLHACHSHHLCHLACRPLQVVFDELPGAMQKAGLLMSALAHRN